MKYSDKLRDPRWQKKRLKILERDEWKCIYCKDTETELQIHHSSYNGSPWEVDDKNLHTLCKHCHTAIEHIKSKYGFENEPQSAYKYKSESGGTTHLLINKDAAILSIWYDDQFEELVTYSRNAFDLLANFITHFYNG